MPTATTTTPPNEGDWIILRLLRYAIRSHSGFHTHPDYPGAALWLWNRVGFEGFSEMCRKLEIEEEERKKLYRMSKIGEVHEALDEISEVDYGICMLTEMQCSL